MSTVLSQQISIICKRLSCLMMRGGKKSPSMRTLGDWSCVANMASSRQLEVPPHILGLQRHAEIPRNLSVSPSELNFSLEYNLPTTSVLRVIHKGKVMENNIFECPSLISGHPLSNPIVEPCTEKEIMAPEKTKVEKLAKNILKIRRRKMNRHHLKKLRKRMKFVFRKRLHRKLKLKEAKLQEEFRAIMKRAEDFEPRDFVQKNLELARKGGFHVNIFESSRQQQQ
ncbi:small ribosomal subunit protein mS38-like [Liolophura sinensis]|uniref:small ribosomal subunit protein mS38-like n=1 Tax=Liolophura sinensis TaxID=3198878 RepID=UPI0031596934